MQPFFLISNLIPLNALLPLGTEAQAQTVISAGTVGNTLLALEHAYGGVRFEDHYEVKTRLEGFGKAFKEYVSGEASLYDASRGIILDFPSGKAEMQVAPADEGGEPLIALVAFHLAGLADSVSDADQAAKMYRAARMVYSV